MNVTMWVCARGASNTREVKLGKCSRAGCWRAASARRRCKVCVCVCCVCLCLYTGHWLRSYKDERVHCVEERIVSVEGNSDSHVRIFVLTPEHHTRVSWQINPGSSDAYASLTLREPRIDTYFLFSFYTHFKLAFYDAIVIQIVSYLACFV